MSAPDIETTEKARRQLAAWVEAVQRGDDWASDLVAWVVLNLNPEAVKGLAQDWDDGQAAAPRPWAIELSEHPGEPVFWNNQDGWGDAGNADRFTDAEKQNLNLPIDGAWVRMEWGSK